MKRYKIDICDYAGCPPFGLYQERTADCGTFLFFKSTYKRWVLIRPFASREEAREHYEAIKDLPEYLGGAK